MAKMLLIGAAVACCMLNFFFVTEGRHSLDNANIVGGIVATRIPYQASLQWNKFHICGAVIIGKQVVLTAAHCLIESKTKKFRIRVGTNSIEKGGQVVGVKKFRKHPKFDMDTGSSEYDIAVLYLNKSLDLNEEVKQIKLYKLNELPTKKFMGIISGWGFTYEYSSKLSKLLQVAKVPVLPRKTCTKYIRPFTEGMLCAGYLKGGTDACSADSGGPLVYKSQLIGIITFGKGCGRSEHPGTYSSVIYFRDWINSTIESFKNSSSDVLSIARAD